MQVEIDLPLLLPHVEEIKRMLLARIESGSRKVVFTAPGLDAAGLQLVVALHKEFPGVEIEPPPVETEGGFWLSLLKELIADVPDYGS